MSKIDLRTATGQEPPIELGQVDIGLADGDTDPVSIVLTNRNNYNLTEVNVSVEGEGARAIQLAYENDEGQPGVWKNGSIMVRQGVLSSNDSVRFWVRAVPVDELELGSKRFEFVVKSIATAE